MLLHNYSIWYIILVKEKFVWSRRESLSYPLSFPQPFPKSFLFHSLLKFYLLLAVILSFPCWNQSVNTPLFLPPSSSLPYACRTILISSCHVLFCFSWLAYKLHDGRNGCLWGFLALSLLLCINKRCSNFLFVVIQQIFIKDLLFGRYYSKHLRHSNEPNRQKFLP